jgi:hypothetical protein
MIDAHEASVPPWPVLLEMLRLQEDVGSGKITAKCALDDFRKTLSAMPDDSVARVAQMTAEEFGAELAEFERMIDSGMQ